MISHAKFSLLEMTVRKKMSEKNGKAKGNILCDACLTPSKGEKYQRFLSEMLHVYPEKAWTLYPLYLITG